MLWGLTRCSRRSGPTPEERACLYVTRLDAVDEDVLRELVELGYAHHREMDASA
ncbi:hypothetical protein [Demequina litorisediminis]|uniref:Uncharacterized protein n=1 Tax=Demequina litorisediminis TaxID=1849022 RepID=A0ABQ6IJE5_9MICO|nr:hypothetical protein GCM10025876_37250 [Demequina litorisediminis]